MRVTIFTEFNKSMASEAGRLAYPEGMNECLRDLISEKHDVKMIVHTADDDGSALTEEILKETDVLVWWGHHYHNTVSDSVVNLVQDYINRGIGLVALHSSHKSKIFMRMVGTPAELRWREINERERLWAVNPAHPIARGMKEHYLEIPHEEMYGEPFAISEPDELVFIGWFQGGEVMRSGCVFNRCNGKVFFFQPGHETNPTYKIPEIRNIILNAIDYVKPTGPIAPPIVAVNPPALEKI